MKKLPSKYQEVVNQLKDRIRQARSKAVYTVNAHLLAVYWEIGNTILEQQEAEGWGTKVIDRLATDLKSEFPDMKGLSVRNLKYMRAFAEAYPNLEFLPEFKQNSSKISTSEIVQATLAQFSTSLKNQVVQVNLAQLSWYHHTTLLDKVKDLELRIFYIQKTIENGWSRDVMVHQIEAELHKRQGNIPNNFNKTIAPPGSELVQQVFKDPYKFDFIYLSEKASERDLEDALTEQITKFLLELGKGFAYVGRQYKMTLNENEYFIDLVFYHTKLKRYVIIDLKIDEFKPEYKGKMEFYLNLADDELKEKDDQPSIGLILCKTKDGPVVEFALRDSTKPIGVATYRVSAKLPRGIGREMPTVKELEQALDIVPQKLERPLDRKLSRLKDHLANLKNEEVREKVNSDNTMMVFKKLVLPLLNKIYELLQTDIVPLFESYNFYIWTDSQGHPTKEIAAEYLLNKLKSRCHIFRVETQLHGFKKAGTQAFDINKRLTIELNNYSYKCEIEGVAGILMDKLYHQVPDNADITKLAEDISVWILEDINQKLQQLGK